MGCLQQFVPVKPGESMESSSSAERVSYSRAEIVEKMKQWMIEQWGEEPKNLEPDQRDQWHRDNGLIYHFICDHFPG